MMMTYNSFWIVVIAFTVSAMLGVYADEVIASDSFANFEGKLDDDVSMNKRPAFHIGSRYGRSPTQLYQSKSRRLNIAPRNDRFFLGSRYGKRSDENESTIPAIQKFSNSNQSIVPNMMTCIYTGIPNLYRCNNLQEINNVIHQLTNDSDDKK